METNEKETEKDRSKQGRKGKQVKDQTGKKKREWMQQTRRQLHNSLRLHSFLLFRFCFFSPLSFVSLIEKLGLVKRMAQQPPHATFPRTITQAAMRGGQSTQEQRQRKQNHIDLFRYRTSCDKQSVPSREKNLMARLPLD